LPEVLYKYGRSSRDIDIVFVKYPWVDYVQQLEVFATVAKEYIQRENGLYVAQPRLGNKSIGKRCRF